MNWYVKVIKNYVTFSGRARRKEFWMFVLINIIISAIAAALDRAFGFSTTQVVNGMTTYNAGIISIIYSLAVLLPGLAVAFRRLQDRKSVV